MTLADIDPAIWLDSAAWEANPAHRWVYDKCLVAQTSNILAAPLGVDPPADAHILVVKPITNLWGMGRGARLMHPAAIVYEPGMMWSEVVQGRHVSVDMRLDPHRRRVEWQATSVGSPSETFGRFDMWELISGRLPETATAEAWALAHLRDYAGCCNIELIGNRVIEVHLRLTQDWLEAGVYGPNDTKPPPAATLIPIWSDDETEGDNGRVGYTVHRLGEAGVA